MKYLLLLIALILVGCESNTTDLDGKKTDINAEYFQFEGHLYIIFTSTNGSYIGVCHSPDCQCMHKEEKAEGKPND
jgi:hypothetical protein